MAKLINFFMILIAVQAALLIYHDATPAPTNIWDFVTNLDNWNSLTFILSWASIAAGIGLVGITAASIFGFKTDFLMLATAIAGIISMGVVLTNFGRVLRNELIERFFVGCDLSSCAPVNLILAITLGPVAFYYVWTVIEWWRGKDF